MFCARIQGRVRFPVAAIRLNVNSLSFEIQFQDIWRTQANIWFGIWVQSITISSQCWKFSLESTITFKKRSADNIWFRSSRHKKIIKDIPYKTSLIFAILGFFSHWKLNKICDFLVYISTLNNKWKQEFWHLLMLLLKFMLCRNGLTQSSFL